MTNEKERLSDKRALAVFCAIAFFSLLIGKVYYATGFFFLGVVIFGVNLLESKK